MLQASSENGIASIYRLETQGKVELRLVQSTRSDFNLS